MHIFFSGAQQADNTFLRRFDNYGKEKTPQDSLCGVDMELTQGWREGCRCKEPICRLGFLPADHIGDAADVPLSTASDAFPLVGICIIYTPRSIC